jgi:WD40 repeat protein/tRNA A-37 threonylcarbamoyl transferase component Bud32
VELVCPHCHNALELDTERPPEEVLCPTCGSSFRLEAETTTDWGGGDNRRSLGKYELLDAVGSGAFGTVYKARDPDLHRVVAVKVPRAGNLAGKGELDRFLREARSVAQLRHPFIVSVYEVGQSGEFPYLVSEFVHGVTLADQLSARPLPPREAAELTARVAEALHYAHEMGVVHRDVKPANIMLSDDGTPRLMDFGLAKRDAGDVTMTIEGQVLGTPAYMSPEQARGEAHLVDGRGDVYSLGVILYQLLTGELPFRGTPRMLLHQVLHDEPRRPRSLNDHIPKDLETICQKAMAKETGRRYQSARELADDLRRWLKGEPIQARPQPAWERVWNWARRRPAVAALLLVIPVAALALAGVGVSSFYNSRLEEKNTELADARRRAEAALQDSRFYQYFHHIALAHAGWREGNLIGVEKLLDDCPDGQRNWEWHYLKRLCHDHSIVHTDNLLMCCVAFSRSGQRLACDGSGNTVRIVDLATRKEIHVLHGHTDMIRDVAFSPDGQRFASASDDGTVKVWEATTGEALFTCKGHSRFVWSIAFSPDGNRLASASWDGTVRFWDARTGQAVGPILQHSDRVWGLAFSPDGRVVVSGASDNAFRMWEVATGRLVRTIAHNTIVHFPIVFSPDGRLLATVDREGNVNLWNGATGLPEKQLRGHRATVIGVAFSPDGRRLATGSFDQTMRIWDVASGLELFTLKGHTSELSGVAFHPDGSWLASASSDGTVRAWPVTLSQDSQSLSGPGADGVELAYSPDGTRLASTARDRTVTLWDTATRQAVRTLTYPLLGALSPTGPQWPPPVVYSPDGSRLAVGAMDGTVPIWDTNSGQLLHQPKLHTGAVWRLAHSPDGARLASVAADATVLLWDARTGQVLKELRGHTQRVMDLAFTPDGTRLASCGRDKTIMIWDATTGSVLDTLRGHTQYVFGIGFSPDGTRLASAGDDNWVVVWELATGRQLRRLPHANTVYRVQFTPDGQRVASASEAGIRIWEVATGLDILTLHGHRTPVSCLSFSSDGTHLASGSFDGAIRIWDARPWTPEGAAEASVDRETLGLLDFLFTKPLRKADVINYLSNTTYLNPEVGRRALSLVERYHEETDPERYHEASWGVARQPHLNNFQYHFALQQAQAACQSAPAEAKYRTTLGAAQYRTGDYQKARSTLTQAALSARTELAGLIGLTHQPLQSLMPLCRAHHLMQTEAANLAFLAMARHQLSEKEQAQAALAYLREVVQQTPTNQEIQDLLREAQTVISARSAGHQ